jgi:protein-S-isoprenylcysteine O-methyltransferase Ste14
MSELTRVRRRTLGWLVLFPGALLGWVPWRLHHTTGGTGVWEGSVFQWLAVWLILNGVGLAGWCVHLFNVEGRGTPVPCDPPKTFVVSGPYRFVRNPMALGWLIILAGEVMLYNARAVFLYWIGLLVAIVCFVRFFEEPQLAKRFGACYAAYQREVPRWIPRTGLRRGRATS